MYIQNIAFKAAGFCFPQKQFFVKLCISAAEGCRREVSSFLQPDNQAASSHLKSEHLLLSNWGGNLGACTTLATLLARLSQTQLLHANNPFHKGRKLMWEDYTFPEINFTSAVLQTVVRRCLAYYFLHNHWTLNSTTHQSSSVSRSEPWLVKNI